MMPLLPAAEEHQGSAMQLRAHWTLRYIFAVFVVQKKAPENNSTLALGELGLQSTLHCMEFCMLAFTYRLKKATGRERSC